MGATLKSMQRESKSSAPRAFWATYCDFAANTGVHGVKYITETDRRPWERVLWFAVVVVGLVGAGMMTATFWERFSTAPTRASVETNFYPSWRLPFPAATLCNMNHIFRSHAKGLFDNLGAVREERALASEGLALMMELVQPNPANSSYRPDLVRAMTELFQRNGMTYREAMAHLDQTCEEMLERCMWEGEIVKCQDIFEERKSYLGMCCSFNYRGVIETTNGNGKKILEIAPGKPRHTPYYSHRLGLSVLMNPMAHDYYMTSLHSAGFRMLIHRVDDYPDESAEEKILPVGREMLVGVTAKSYYCTEDVRGLVPAVRGCVFQDERRLRYFPIYSATNCLTECRINYSALFCNCSPFYYHEVEEIRTCTFEDIPCLDKYYFALRRRLNSMVIVKDQDAMTSSTTATAINCDCPPLCSQVDYDVHVSSGDFNASRYQRSRLLKGANVTGRTLMHFFMSNSVSKRTKRNVVSSWSELLSSLGGVFSLCLGFSVLSVIEMIYFFTMRLAFRYRRLALPAGRPGVIDDADLLQPAVTSNNVPKFLSQPSQKSKPFPTRVGAWGTAPTAGFSLWKNQL